MDEQLKHILQRTWAEYADVIQQLQELQARVAELCAGETLANESTAQVVRGVVATLRAMTQTMLAREIVHVRAEHAAALEEASALVADIERRAGGDVRTLTDPDEKRDAHQRYVRLSNAQGWVGLADAVATQRVDVDALARDLDQFARSWLIGNELDTRTALLSRTKDTLDGLVLFAKSIRLSLYVQGYPTDVEALHLFLYGDLRYLMEGDTP